MGNYDQRSHGIGVTGGSGGTIEYSSSANGPWRKSKSTDGKTVQLYPGTITTYVRMLGDENHNTKSCGSAKVTINKINDTITLTAKASDYTGSVIKANEATATSKTNITYTYYNGTSCSGTALSGAPINAGTYSVKAVSAGNSNYNSGSKCVTHTINKVNPTCPALTDYVGNYDQRSHGIGVTGGNGGTIEYSTSENGPWSTTKPLIKGSEKSGTLTTYVRMKGDTNHNTILCGSKKVIVNPAVQSVSLDLKNLNIGVGESGTIKATVNPSSTKCSWESSNPSIATVTSGVVKGVKEGNANITITCSDKSATAKVVVESRIKNVESEYKVDGPKITNSVVTLNQGESLQLNFDKANSTCSKIAWESRNKKVVTVSAGIITANNNGITGNVKVFAYCDSEHAKSPSKPTLNFELASANVTVLNGEHGSKIPTSCFNDSKDSYKEGETLKYCVENGGNYYLTYIWMKNPYKQIKKLEANTALNKKIVTDEEVGNNSKRTTVENMLKEYVGNGIIDKEGNVIIPDNKTVLAFNAGSFYETMEDGFHPPKVSGGKYYENRSGLWLEINEGKLTRNRYDDGVTGLEAMFGISKDGYLIRYSNSGDENDRKIIKNNVNASGLKNTFAYEQDLVHDGNLISGGLSNSSDERQAICQVDANNYIMFTTNEYETGISYSSLANLFKGKKCITAISLDGGGSTSFFVRKDGKQQKKVCLNNKTGGCRNIAQGIAFVEQ